MNEKAPATQETSEDRQARITSDHMNYQRVMIEKEQDALDKEQNMKERIQNASPDDIHWAMNSFSERNIKAKIYLKDKVQELAEDRGVNELDAEDYDARDAIFEEITQTTEYGRKLLEADEDDRKQGSASILLGEWHGLPDDSRGTFSSYLNGEMMKAREAAANNGGTDRLDVVSGAGEWCGKFLSENLRDYYNSGIDRTGEVQWDSYTMPNQGQTDGLLSQIELEQAKQQHQRLSIR
jgi:hypothetical protein